MDSINVKILILLTFLITVTLNCFSQYSTIVNIGSIYNGALKSRMDANSTKLLTEINNSYANGTIPSLSGIDMTAEAKSHILALWETSPFRCKETEIIENIVINNKDLELRNILIYMKKANLSEQNTEARIDYTNRGIIDDFQLTLKNKQIINVMSEGIGVVDIRRRQIIINFVENFKTAYNRRDISYLNKVFSEDALIITGRVINVAPMNREYMRLTNSQQIVYRRENKITYISNLQKIFDANSYLNITFEELEVVLHPQNPDYYGVRVKQSWDAIGFRPYSDIGYLFLLIDFTNEDSPIIHVRTWQPHKVDGRELRRDELIDIGSVGNLN